MAIDQLAPRSARRKPSRRNATSVGFSVGLRAGRLDVGALDEPDVHAGVDQRVGVGGRAQQVRLHRRAEPIGQATCRHLEHAGQDRVGAGGVLRTDLDAAARGQGLRDGGEAIRRRGAVGVQGQVRQVHGQPGFRGRRWQRGGELEVVV